MAVHGSHFAPIVSPTEPEKLGTKASTTSNVTNKDILAIMAICLKMPPNDTMGT